MAAYEVQIGDRLVAELNDPARAWPVAFVATRRWLPRVKPEELGEDLQVTVIVPEIEQEQFHRTEDVFRYGAAIGMQKRVAGGEADLDAECDELTRLAEAVHDFYRNEHELAGLAGWRVVEAQRPEVYDLQRLHADGIWETLIVLTVEGYKS